MSAPLVVGVDVGSQGTCAQALEPDGTLVATTRWPHALSYPRAGWAEQERAEWIAALVRVLAELRAVCAGREIAALSFGSQLDGLVACAADGSPLRPALIWCDRRAGDVCASMAVDVEWLRGADRLQPGPGARRPEDRVAGAPRAGGVRRRGGVRAAGRVGGVAGVRRAGRRSLQRVLDGAARSAHAGVGGRGVRGAGRGGRAAAGRAGGALGARAGGAVAVRGDGVVVLDAGGAGLRGRDGGDARGRRGRARRRVRRDGHRRAGLRGRRRARVRRLRRGRAAPARRSRTPGCSRTPAGCPAARTAGSATSWASDASYEELNSLAAQAPAGSDGVVWVPALAGAMAPEWNPNARAGWFGVTAAHGRAHLVRSLLEGNALALRDVLEAIARRGPSAARGRLRRRRRERPPEPGAARERHRPSGLAPGRRRDDLARRGDARGGGRRLVRLGRRGGARDGLAARRAGLPDDELRAVYDELHARHRRVYEALKPLWDAPEVPV